jgi:hypothetical protein
MTLASSGQMTTAQIMTELGYSIQFLSSYGFVCSLAGKATGSQIDIPSDFYGKTRMSVSISDAQSGTKGVKHSMSSSVAGNYYGSITYAWSTTGGTVTGSATGSTYVVTLASGDTETVYLTVTDGNGSTAITSKSIATTGSPT